VWAVFFGSLVAAALVGLGIYFFVLRYAPVAHQHVPENAGLVVHLDLEQVVMFEPARRHLIPLLGAGAPPGEPRLERIAKATGVQLTRDLREAALVVWPRESGWAVLGGGFFRRGVLPKMAAVLAAEDASWTLGADDLLVGPRGLAFTQASDGLLILASSAERARQVRDTTRAGSRNEGAWSVALSPSMVAARGHELTIPWTSVGAQAELGLPMRVELWIRTEPGPSPGDELSRILKIGGADVLPGADRVRVNDGTAQVTWSAQDLDRAAAFLAEQVRSLTRG
jgi:hypothetical protein